MSNHPDLEPDLAFGEFAIVRGDERLVGPQGPAKIGRKAYRLLLMLAESEGRLVTKDAIFTSVWDGTIVTESALTSVVKELRRALGDQSVAPRYIESVYGRGYRLIAPVEPRAPRASAAIAPPEGKRGERRLGEAPLLFVPAFEAVTIAASHPDLGAVLHEELLIALSRFREIRLVSEMGPQEAAGGARAYRLSMRLLSHGDGMLAFIRITRLASGAIVWAEQIGLPRGEAKSDVGAIARRVAGVVMPRLREDMLRVVPQPPRDGYDHYFANRLRMRDLDSLEDGRALAQSWESLIADHPGLVQAYPPLIRLYNTDYGFTGPGAAGGRERTRAYELAHRAVAADPTDSHLHTVKAWCHLWAGEPGLALRHFEEALQLNPHHQERLVEIATGFMFLDALERAAELIDRCRALAVSASDVPQEEAGLLLLLQQDYHGAVEALTLARGVHPDDRAKVRPSPLSGLYGLLAAAGSGGDGLAEQARDWRAGIAARWAGAEPLDDARLGEWVMFHNPFQREARRAWLRSLFHRALAAAAGAPNRRSPAPRQRPSARD